MRRTIPCIRQMEDADCGAACLAMVFDYFDKRVDLSELRDMTGASRDGVTALSTRQRRERAIPAAGRAAVKADIDDLRHVPRGSILHWGVQPLRRVRADHAPRRQESSTRRTGGGSVSLNELRRAYTGVAIIFEPADDFDRTGLRRQGHLALPAADAQAIEEHGQGPGELAVPQARRARAAPAHALVVDEIVPHGDNHLLLVLALGVGAIIGYNFLSAFLRANLLVELRTRLDMGLTMGFMRPPGQAAVRLLPTAVRWVT